MALVAVLHLDVYQLTASSANMISTQDLPAAVQLVVVSPLRRTLETAAGVFGMDGAGEGRPLLMQGQQGVTHEISPHAALVAPAGLPFLAHEGCRERVGGSWLRVCACLATICPAWGKFIGLGTGDR